MVSPSRILLAGLGCACILAAACNSFSGSDGAAGADAGEGGSTAFCRNQDAAYCADFDDDALPYGTMKGASTPEAMLTATTKAFISPPRSLLAHAPVVEDDGGNQTEQAVVIADGIVIGGGRRIEADIKPTGSGSGTIIQVYPLGADGTVPSGGFLVYAKSLDLTAFTKDGLSLDHGTIFSSLGTAWIHVVMDIAPAASGVVVTVFASVDGQSGMTQKVTLPGGAGKCRVVFGSQPNHTLGQNPFELELDNLVVR